MDRRGNGPSSNSRGAADDHQVMKFIYPAVASLVASAAVVAAAAFAAPAQADPATDVFLSSPRPLPSRRHRPGDRGAGRAVRVPDAGRTRQNTANVAADVADELGRPLGPGDDVHRPGDLDLLPAARRRARPTAAAVLASVGSVTSCAGSRTRARGTTAERLVDDLLLLDGVHLRRTRRRRRHGPPRDALDARRASGSSSGSVSPNVGHAPWLAGSSCTQRNSVGVRVLVERLGQPALRQRSQLLDRGRSRRRRASPWSCAPPARSRSCRWSAGSA